MSPVTTTDGNATRRRLPHLALIAVLALSLLALPAATASASGSARETVVVDPGLVDATRSGPVPAIVAWDGAVASRADVRAHLASTGAPSQMFSHLDMAVVCVGSERDVTRVAATPGGISVWGDEDLRPTFDPSVMGRGGDAAPGASTAAPARSEATGAAADLTGAGVGIVVLDTGVDGRHPDLAYGPRTVQNTVVAVSHYEILGVGEDTCAPDTFVEDAEDSETDSGHGTFLAGVAAGDGTASSGQIRGMAPDADVVGVSVIEPVTPEGQGDVKASLIRFIAGVNHTLSTTLVGGPTTAKVAIIGWGRDGLYDPFHPHFLAVRDLWDFGIVPVVPAGNEGQAGVSSCETAAACHFNPLSVGAHVISVGATTPDGRALATFSSRGDPVERNVRGKNVNYEPTIVAPGTAVAAFRPGIAAVGTPAGTSQYTLGASGDGQVSTNPRYQSLTGTSVAAATVAGAIALMQEEAVRVSGCYLLPFQVRNILETSADGIPQRQRHEVGAGALDVDGAVALAGDQLFYGGNNPWDCAPR